MANSTFRIFTEHLGGTQRADFIGNYGDIFYDPDTQQIWLSDGETPGGLPIATGNVVPYILPIATTTQLGGVKIDGTTITIANGVISSSGGSGSNVNLSNVSSSIIPSANLAYTLGNSTNQWQSLYVAANTIYFGNTSFSVLANGQIVTGGNIEYITANALMTAFASLLTSGNNIILEYNANNEQWTIAGQYANGSYILPVASTSTLGGVKIDANTIVIDGSGVISANVSAGFSNGANISVNELTVLSDIVLTDTPTATITANNDLDIYAGRIQFLPQDGGNMELYGGVGDGVGNVGGDITLLGGYGINGAGPGLISISGAQQTQAGQNGGAVSINGGISWGGSGGNVYMSAGPANSGAHGSVHVGLSNTTEIYIGAAGANVVLVGNVTINGAVPAAGLANGANVNFNLLTVNGLTVNSGITANGSVGTDGQVLTSNGSTVYWSTAAGGGGVANGANVNFNQLTVSGLTVNSGITANGGVGTAGQLLTSNGSVAYWSTRAASFSNGQSISVNNADVTGRLRATNLGAYVTYGVANNNFGGAAGYKFVEFDNSKIIDSFNAADTGIYCGNGTGTNSEFRYLHFASETAVFQVTFSATCDGINADNDYYALIKYDTSGNPTVLGYYPISYTVDLNNTSTGHGTATVKLLSTVTSGAGEKIKLGLYTGSSGTWRTSGCSIQFTRLR